MTSSASQAKRARVSKVGGYVKLSEGLSTMFGGRSFCREAEVTRDQMLQFLKSTGQITLVKVIKVTVLTKDERKFSVHMEARGGSNSLVYSLKKEIEKVEGLAPHRQDLFYLENRVDSWAPDGQPLPDNFEVFRDCTVSMRVRPPLLWRWDDSSDLVIHRVIQLSGPSNNIATKIDQDRSVDNTMVISPTMSVKGKHTISLKLDDCGAGLSRYGIGVGVVVDGVSSRQYHGQRDSTVGWFLGSGGGGLCGNGQADDHGAGVVKPGQVVTMELDLDNKSLCFFVDGKIHGPGYTSGVTGVLRFAVTLGFIGNSVTILPTTERKERVQSAVTPVIPEIHWRGKEKK